MPKKDSAAAVLTGSTGDVKIDATPRGAWMGTATGVTFFLCLVFNADGVVTGAAMTLSANLAYLSTVAFDGFIRPRL